MTATLSIPETMKAVLFYAPGDVRYETTPTPQPGPGELLMEVKTALTCGTDLKTFRRGHPVLLKSFPSPFGHEGAGIVAAVGDGVTRFAVGDRVVIANSAPCLECYFCRKEQFNLCQELDLLNGTYAQYLRVPARIAERNTLKLPEGLSFEPAAFCEPLAVCVRGIEACNIQPGDTVAVLGLGSIGLMMAKLAKLKGAKVVGFGRNPLKCKLAETFAKVDTVLPFDSLENMAELRHTHSPEGLGFDVVIEAVGQPVMWERAIDLVRRGGLVNLFGGCQSGTTITVDTRRLHYDEITLISLFHYTPRHFAEALDLISRGKLDPTPLVTHRMPLSGVTDALALMAEGQAIKVALYPEPPTLC